MATASLSRLTLYCDRLLRTGAINDYDEAFNGLQVANRGQVRRIAAAVDATAVTVKLAIAAKADFLIVHHGLFWSLRQPWTGRNYELLRSLLENNLAVYSSHLPLDVHPTLGNNVQLCAALGLKPNRPFFECKGHLIGTEARARVPREELVRRLEQALGGPVRLAPGGSAICRRIGIITGGAGNELRQAAEAGLDTFITGEGAHWTFGLAEELGLNVVYGGHYATEMFGVKALAAQLARKFGVPWTFLHHPTGL